MLEANARDEREEGRQQVKKAEVGRWSEMVCQRVSFSLRQVCGARFCVQRLTLTVGEGAIGPEKDSISSLQSGTAQAPINSTSLDLNWVRPTNLACETHCSSLSFPPSLHLFTLARERRLQFRPPSSVSSPL